MTRAATPRMTAEARREQLLDAAKAVVADHGFHGVSIEAVARGAGITRPIVYRHFDDLAALLDALVERETLRALVQLREVLPADVDGPDRGVRGLPERRPQRPGDVAARARRRPRARRRCCASGSRRAAPPSSRSSPPRSARARARRTPS